MRRLAAGGASIAFGSLFLRAGWSSNHVDWSEALLLTIVAAAAAIAAGLVWSRRLPAQLLARACWWCFLLVSEMGAILSGAREHPNPAFGVLFSGLALLAIGRYGLEQESGAFKPVAFRGTLQLSLVLAMADTASLAICGLVNILIAPEMGYATRLFPLAAFTGLGVVGLLRLRTWGLLVALTSNVLVGVLALTRRLPVPAPLQYLFLATTLLQVIVPIPMLVRLILRRPPPMDRFRAFRAVGATVAIVTLVGFGLYAGLVRETPLFSFSGS